MPSTTFAEKLGVVEDALAVLLRLGAADFHRGLLGMSVRA
jgi:hypothetical protein